MDDGFPSLVRSGHGGTLGFSPRNTYVCQTLFMWHATMIPLPSCSPFARLVESKGLKGLMIEEGRATPSHLGTRKKATLLIMVAF